MVWTHFQVHAAVLRQPLELGHELLGRLGLGLVAVLEEPPELVLVAFRHIVLVVFVHLCHDCADVEVDLLSPKLQNHNFLESL